jgi:hypothetical protein
VEVLLLFFFFFFFFFFFLVVERGIACVGAITLPSCVVHLRYAPLVISIHTYVNIHNTHTHTYIHSHNLEYSTFTHSGTQALSHSLAFSLKNNIKQTTTPTIVGMFNLSVCFLRLLCALELMMTAARRRFSVAVLSAAAVFAAAGEAASPASESSGAALSCRVVSAEEVGCRDELALSEAGESADGM